MNHRYARSLACALALLPLGVIVAAQPQQSPPGPHAPDARVQVMTHSFVLRDTKRDKDLPVRVVYPEQFTLAGPVPTIIFSHGAGGSGEMYNPLAFAWASHGYIVIQPTHSDSLTATKATDEDARPLERLRNRRNRTKPARGLPGGIDFSDWANRPRDISFVIDSVELIEQQVPALAERIDRGRIGVGGHSFGAFTAQLIGGTDPLGREDFSDSRAICQLLISPQGIGGLFIASSWDAFRGPALTISGDNDTGLNDEPAAWRRDPFDNSPPDTHTLLWITNAYHNFGGITGRVIPWPGQGPANPAHVELVKRASLAFWDHHLRDASDDTDAFANQLRELLQGEAVSIENN